MEIPKGYVKIPITLLGINEPLKMNIFLHMPVNRKLVHFRRKGEVLSLQDFMTLRPMAPSQILMPEFEYKEAIEALTKEAAGLLTPADEKTKNSPPPPEIKTMASFVLQNLGTKLGNTTTEEAKNTLDDSSQLVASIVTQLKGLGNRKSFDEYLTSLKSNDPLTTHNRHVGALAGIIMMAMGSFKMDWVADISFAGFVHDIALNELPNTFLDQHLGGENLSIDHLRAHEFGYYRHVDLSFKKIEELGIVASADARTMIMQHHENFDGSGLLGIRGDKIFKPASILRIADDLVSVINNPKHTLSIQDAFALLLEMNKNHREVYDPSIMKFLQTTMFK